MIHWKFAAFCAGIAALLSILAGLFGRVSAGNLIFRAILACIVFGGLACGMELLVRKFLPELLSGGEDVDNESGEVETGGEVDIIVDDDEPVSFAPLDEQEDTVPAAEEGDIEDVGITEISGEGELSEVPQGGDFEPGQAPGDPEAVPGQQEAPADTGKNGNGLPDIGDFSGSYAGIDSLDSGKARRLDAVDSIEKENDPATMAQAIRSILHKDQEG